MTTAHATTLRQRMIQGLQLAGLGERTQEAYVRAVRKLAAHYNQSPDQLTEAAGQRPLARSGTASFLPSD